MTTKTHGTGSPYYPSNDPDHDQIIEWSAEKAADAWKENAGLSGAPERIRSHWAKIQAWLNEPPKTIRYMDKLELAALRAEIIDALLAQGTTPERAEKLLKSFPTVGDRLGLTPKDVLKPAPAEEKVITDPGAKTAPYINHSGELVIPYNCPPKYRWWQGGQSVAETLAELTSNTAATAR